MKTNSLPRTKRTGFTLIEVLVVVAIIALLTAILLPSLREAREQAKETVCASNLGILGRGFHSYAAASADYLCSGASMPDAASATGRDGLIDRVGWMADLVNSKTAVPQQVLCPTNPRRFNQKLAQAGSNKGPYTEVQATNLIGRGYNSNYTQVWYMARTEVSNPNEANMNRIIGKRGPLKTSYMLRVTPSRVPIMGDGGLSEDTYRGEPTVKTLTDGPHGGPFGVQEFDDLSPAHGMGSGVFFGRAQTTKLRAVVLFADGHSDRFTDRASQDAAGNRVGRDGEFGMDDADPINPIQHDLDQARVFDGVISLGRRSHELYERK